MADKWRTATGDWSTAAEWNDSALPGTTDDCFADGYTCAIDTTITVGSIRTTQRSGGTAGGGFTVAGTRSVNANVLAGSTHCITFSGGADTTLTSTGTVTGGASTSAHGITFSAAGGNVAIVGNCVGGSGTNNGSAVNVTQANTTIAITGNLTCGGANSYGARVAGGSIVFTVTGDLVATSGGAGIWVNTGQIVVVGDIYASGSQSAIVSHSISGGSTKLTGNSYGGTNGGQNFVTKVVTLVDGESYSHTYKDADAAAQTPFYGLTAANFPAVADVEDGVLYGPANIYEGTLAVGGGGRRPRGQIIGA